VISVIFLFASICWADWQSSPNLPPHCDSYGAKVFGVVMFFTIIASVGILIIQVAFALYRGFRPLSAEF
jgi:hypothetical protein